MTRAMNLIGNVAYWLGLIGVVVSVLLKFLPEFGARINASPRGGLILAACLFLCTLASHKMAKGA